MCPDQQPADPDQLFDLESDPRERTSLADDPASAGLAGASGKR
jgi:hypothetical protein